MITLKNNPISIVQDPICKEFAEFKYKTSIGVVRKIIFKMMQLAKETIIAQLKSTTCGEITHDGQSRCGIHYLSYFNCYIFNNYSNFRLISLTPITNKVVNEKIDTTMEDATKFNSDTHKTHFITIMKDIYEIDLITGGEHLLQTILMKM